MQIEKITLSQFRNYTREEVVFSPRLNYIEGNNAEGKSNLLEAIYLLSTGKSFRTTKLHTLVQQGQSGFCLEALFTREGIAQELRVCYHLSPPSKQILYNQTSYASFLPLLGIIPCILLAPEDISFIIGSPLERRKFLDLHLSQLDPLYVHHLGRYHKALQQKNLLLKQQKQKDLLPWEQVMALSASYLVKKRIETLLLLEKDLQQFISIFSETSESFSWRYENSATSIQTEDFLLSWEKNRKKEFLLGTTLSGPHRDDIGLFLQGQEVKTYCSEGQKRCCMAALRLAEWKRFQHSLGVSPLFAVDDFAIHLDEKRQGLLSRSLAMLGQVFLTSPSFSSEQRKRNHHVVYVTQGSIHSSLLQDA